MKITETKTDTTGFIKLSPDETIRFLYELQGTYFYHTDGRLLGSAIRGPAADRYEGQLKALYGKSAIKKKGGSFDGPDPYRKYDN